MPALSNAEGLPVLSRISRALAGSLPVPHRLLGRTSRPVATRSLCLLALFILATGLPAHGAAVSVVDNWDEAGYFALATEALGVAFSRQEGPVRVYDLSGAQKVEVMWLVPFGADQAKATSITSCRLLESSQNEARCQVAFATKTAPMEATFALTSSGAIRVQPSESMAGISVSARFSYGVLPSRHLDDNIYDANSYPSLTRLHIPSENLFMGLLQGGHRMLVCAWPSGEQAVRLALAGAKDKRRIEALELTLAGKEVFIGAFCAPGIWHGVPLRSSYVEQDVTLNWKPPFSAKWKTQLTELGTPTTFYYQGSRTRRWRPTIGFYIFPLFSQNGKVFLRLHKKLASKGKALIYALEGHERTPYSFLTRNLPAEEQRTVTELHAVQDTYALDPSPIEGGWTMNTHCAGKSQLQHTTLAVGSQSREAEFLDTHAGDREHECRALAKYSFQRSLDHMTQLSEQLDGWLKQESANPAVLSFLRSLKDTLTAMQQEYRGRLGGDSSDHVAKNVQQAAQKLRAAIRAGGGLELCPEILFHINALNYVISMDEDLSRRFGTWGRRLFQQAGYACVNEPKAAEYAEKIRASLREQMRYRHYETPFRDVRSLLPAE